MIKNLKNILMNKKKKSAFTLIELIIVIAIIAILAAVALPKFGEVRENANRKSDVSNAKNIQSAVVALINDDKIYFDATTTTEILIDSTVTGKATGTAAEMTVNYMQTVPKLKAKKAKGNPFKVVIDTNGDVSVCVGGTTSVEIYPNGEGDYKELTAVKPTTATTEN